VAYLVSEAGADVNARRDVMNFETPLKCAVAPSHLQVVSRDILLALLLAACGVGCGAVIGV
jgi:hypothetical protein